MNPEPSNLLKNMKRLAIIVTVAFCMYEILFTVNVLQTTGILEVNSSSKSATLSISQETHEAKIIGRGTAKVHLKPGSYLLSASQNGYQTTAIATVTVKETTTISLNLTKASINTDTVELVSKLPLLGPGAEYQITATTQVENNSSGPVITITSSSSLGRQNALQWIKNQGLDPSDLNIKYQTEVIKNYHYTSGLP